MKFCGHRGVIRQPMRSTRHRHFLYLILPRGRIPTSAGHQPLVLLPLLDPSVSSAALSLRPLPPTRSTRTLKIHRPVYRCQFLSHLLRGSSKTFSSSAPPPAASTLFPGTAGCRVVDCGGSRLGSLFSRVPMREFRSLRSPGTWIGMWGTGMAAVAAADTGSGK